MRMKFLDVVENQQPLPSLAGELRGGQPVQPANFLSPRHIRLNPARLTPVSTASEESEFDTTFAPSINLHLET